MYILAVIFGYLIGSIPTGYLFTRFIKNIDVREVGSGNVGATNAARALGIRYGIIVALLDIAKGFVAVSIAFLFINPQGDMINYIPYLTGLTVILGHDHSLFLNFSGGKGVAATFGVLLRISPPVFLIIAVIWLLLSVITRYMSAASLTSAVLMPIVLYIYLNEITAFYFFIIYGFLIIGKHHGNIKRLLRGNENRINVGKS